MSKLKTFVELINKLPSVHSDGKSFVMLFAILSLAFGFVWETLGWIGLILTSWCAYFFRDPNRVVPKGGDIIVSPADGVVCAVTKAAMPSELGMEGTERTRISIFLSIFDVHVNRVPANGEIESLYYNPGKFLSANLDKASDDNERQTILMKTESGQEIVFVQIAGMIARRIVCNLEEGQKVVAGERFGLIRFGSRVDVYLPEGVDPLVSEGQRMIGGETILADLNNKIKARKSVTR